MADPHLASERPRPIPLPVLFESIPELLRAACRWVVWDYEWRQSKNGKPGTWAKPPFIATALDRGADPTDPTTWRSFSEARAAYEDRTCDGIGFVLGDGWVGFDSDGNDASDHVGLLNSYTERSPSGLGVHSIMLGTKPGTRCRTGPYELYDHGRYFTVTGHHIIGMPTAVEERTTEIAALYARLFPSVKIAASRLPDRFAGDGCNVGQLP